MSCLTMDTIKFKVNDNAGTFYILMNGKKIPSLQAAQDACKDNAWARGGITKYIQRGYDYTP